MIALIKIGEVAVSDNSPDVGTDFRDDSKPNAVAATVAAQLQHEGRWPPNDITKLMASDYHYTQQTIATFLAAVQWHLQHGNPSYQFTFDPPFVIQALGLTVAALINEVNNRTT